MTTLLVGEDSPSKDSKISEIKAKLFPSKDSLPFDYEIVHVHKLDPESFKKNLMGLPAVSPQRLLVLRDCHKMSAENKAILKEFLKGKTDHVELVLDFGALEEENSFFNELKSGAKVFDFRKGPSANVFDMARMISRGNKPEALKVLSELFLKGEAPVQILGGLVWAWRNSKNFIPKEKFHQGLRSLQEADLNIKRSRLKPEYALELLVVKLCG